MPASRRPLQTLHGDHKQQNSSRTGLCVGGQPVAFVETSGPDTERNEGERDPNILGRHVKRRPQQGLRGP